MKEIDTIEELLSLKKDLKNTSYKDKLRCIDNAISFIIKDKQNNEFCEWKWEKINKNNSQAMVQCKGDKVLFESIRLFTYCPYCGKEIKTIN